MHRFQISVFGAIAIVFAVQGVTDGIFAGVGSLNAMGAGWLILSIVDILWVLYFTSEEDSLVLHLFNLLGTGGLTPPSRRRRTRTQSSMHNVQGGNGYASNYSSGGIGSHDFDGKAGSAGFGSPNPNALRTQNSFGGSLNDTSKPFGSTGGGSIRDQPVGATGSIIANDNGAHSPLMAGVGAGNLSTPSATNDAPPTEVYSYKAKAMYACK
jgi:SHO1 osmosensor